MSTRYFTKLFDCDTARIVEYNTKFLIIGWNRNTAQDSSAEWFRNGERFNFDYVEEKVVAQGRTDAELTASAKRYKRLLGMTALEYLTEQVSKRAGDPPKDAVQDDEDDY